MNNAHQLNRYIVYTCKKCEWQTAILATWPDLKPKSCQNSKCRCSFIRDPDMLGIQVPKKSVAKKATKKVVKVSTEQKASKKSSKRKKK